MEILAIDKCNQENGSPMTSDKCCTRYCSNIIQYINILYSVIMLIWKWTTVDEMNTKYLLIQKRFKERPSF